MIRVAITDDHLLIIKGLKELLSQLPDITLAGTFMTVEETRAGLSLVNPDVLLLDLNLPDGDGMLFCKEIKKDYPKLNVLALTTYNQAVLIKNVMRNGASGFLLKNTSLDELHDAIQTVHQGQQYLQQEVKHILLQHMIGEKRQQHTFQPVLSRREKEILQLIVNEHTTQEIAAKLFISIKTVESHRTHLMDKLGVRNLAGLVKVAIEKGLC